MAAQPTSDRDHAPIAGARYDLLIPPDHFANHPDFGKASDTNCLEFGSGRQHEFRVKEISLLAPVAPHPAGDAVNIDVAENLFQVLGAVVSLDAAIAASDQRKLTDASGIAHPPHCATAPASPVRSLHEKAIGINPLSRQG
ncbi:hypothetical protein AB4144_03390 [Rhizobiaceae sp. 2RAB30]